MLKISAPIATSIINYYFLFGDFDVAPCTSTGSIPQTVR